MTISKSELRRLIRDRESALPAGGLRREDGALIEKLLSSPEFAAARRVLLYFGVGTEIDTAPVIAAALSLGKDVALPRVTGPGLMEARRVTEPSKLVPGAFGIPEPGEDCELMPPDSFDLILVPGAAFSPDGRRLGRGGGFYDRYLPKTAGVKAALVRGIQLTEDVPTAEHDIKMDIIIRS